jgi:hypothetical protein
MCYEAIRNMQERAKERQNTEKVERKRGQWGIKRPLSTRWALLGLLGDAYYMGVGILLYALYRNLFLRSSVASFQMGRGLELHVSELLWAGSKGDPQLDRFYCSSEVDISCGNLFNKTAQTS